MIPNPFQIFPEQSVEALNITLFQLLIQQLRKGQPLLLGKGIPDFSFLFV